MALLYRYHNTLIHKSQKAPQAQVVSVISKTLVISHLLLTGINFIRFVLNQKFNKEDFFWCPSLFRIC